MHGVLYTCTDITIFLVHVHRKEQWLLKGEGRISSHVLPKLLWRAWNSWSTGIY